MKKSVYSLVLMDDIVKAIDDMAYRRNTSRSNLINQILAEHISYKTPESMMRDIFDRMKTIMDSNFQIQGQSSDAMLSIRSPLRYKYKPNIRYRVELMREVKDGVFGNLSVSFRTQSSQLIELMNNFFSLWYKLEKRYMDKYFPDGVEYTCMSGRFVRKLKIPAELSNEDTDLLGKAIVDYIRLLDSEIKIYFSDIDDPERATLRVEANLLNNINSGIMII